ncbi:MAG: RnfH family protein [Rhodocyclaceae bacterium]|nr:MAG: RnfH family protein [Rhodocyclaceae bacterium]
MGKTLQVEVVYATPDRQEVASVSLPAGSTVAQAIEASGLLGKHPDIDLNRNKLGIYAKLANPDTALRDRDRVEIYRPLIADSKEMRKQRAAEGKATRRGEGESE